jgi:nucleotide-binding universal stress UspA family protein
MAKAMSTSQRTPVVVGVDGSRSHLATIDIAVVEAVRRRAALLIVHVWPGRYTASLRGSGPGPAEADGRHLLEIAARRALHRAPNLDVSTELLDGGTAAALVQRSLRSQLLVVGHRDDVLTRHGWGSTAAYLAHHCACPLMVHRGEALERGPVVVAVSTSDSAEATVRCAFQEAAWYGSRLVAVHVWTHPTGRGASRSTVVADYAVSRDEADRRLAEALTGSVAAYPDVAVERLVLHDLDVAYTLERASQRGRLLVAGMGRNGRFAELLYGSLGLSMMRRSACPVLLVPERWEAPLPEDQVQATPATADQPSVCSPTVPSTGADRP